jgi:hypothetical protein
MPDASHCVIDPSMLLSAVGPKMLVRINPHALMVESSVRYAQEAGSSPQNEPVRGWSATRHLFLAACLKWSAFLAVLAVLIPCELLEQTSSDGKWRFAVFGDSRNCGDVVMPAIAKKFDLPLYSLQNS